MAKRGAAVLEMPEPEYAPVNGSRSRPPARSRRDSVEDFADEYSEREEPRRVSRVSAPRPGITLKWGSRLPLPRTTAGLVASGVALLLLLGAVVWLLAVTRSFLLHDARFAIANAAAIEIEGNHHLKRSQVLGLFAEDLERNIFGVSLDQRKADLEAMPWVQRATVMRLLPGRLRVSLVERTPVAFVRQGAHIGLVDGHGVLLEMATGVQAERYSFPVVTGIAATDAASTRASRMKLFARFVTELDSAGTKNTENLSEVDLSNPDDVKAIVSEHGATVLVHFGEDQFLERYERVKQLLPQWHAQYPNLASADMRYEHEIPLAMAAAVKAPAAAVAVHPVAKAAAAPVKAAVHRVAGKPVSVVKPAAIVAPGKQAFVPAPVVSPWQGAVPGSEAASVSAAARSGFAAKAATVVAGKPGVSAPVKPAAKAPGVGAVGRQQVPLRNDSRSAVPQQSTAHLQGAVHPPVPHAGAHGKPSAGKPLVMNDSNPSSQAAQR